MASLKPTFALAVVLALSGGALAACGEDEEGRGLTRVKASELRSTLARVEESAVSGDCSSAQEQAAALREQVDSVSRRVYRDLRSALAAGAARLETLVSERCEPKVEEAPTVPEPTTTQPPAEEQPSDEEGDDEGSTGGEGQKDKELPPGQEKKLPDEQSGGQNGGTFTTPEDGSGGAGGEVAP
jgi:hypothetical protein